MEKNEFLEQSTLKRSLDKSIEYLTLQVLTDKEFIEKVKLLLKTLLPNNNRYFTSVILKYAKVLKTFRAYEDILDNAIKKYCEVKYDKAE